jgi:hypothetical protein
LKAIFAGATYAGASLRESNLHLIAPPLNFESK